MWRIPKRQAEDLRAEIEQLKQLRTNYFIRTRAMIRSQEELLQAMERDQVLILFRDASQVLLLQYLLRALS
jgi:hypothetical protein